MHWRPTEIYFMKLAASLPPVLFFFFIFFYFFFMKWHLFSPCIHMNWVKWIRPFSSLLVNRVTNKRWKGRKSRKLIQPMIELKKIYPVINKLVPLRFLPNYIFSIFFLGKKKTWDKTNSELNQFDSHISLFREYRGHLLRLHVSMLRLMDLILKSVLQQRKLILSF